MYTVQLHCICFPCQHFMYYNLLMYYMYVFGGNLLQVRRGGEHLQGQVWGEPGDVGGEWLDSQTGPLRLVPVVLQVKIHR